MNSNDLTRQQCDELFEQLGPHMAYFRKLEERMHAKAFPEGDKIFVMVKLLAKTSHELRCELHERARLLALREAK